MTTWRFYKTPNPNGETTVKCNICKRNKETEKDEYYCCHIDSIYYCKNCVDEYVEL